MDVLCHRRLAAVDRRVVGGAPQHLGAIAAHPGQRDVGGPDVARGDGQEADVVRAGQRHRGPPPRRGRLRAGGNGSRRAAPAAPETVRNRRRDRFGMGRPSGSAPWCARRPAHATRIFRRRDSLALTGIALEDPVRIAVIASLVLVATVRMVGQQPAPPPTDRTKATRFSAEDLRAGLAKLPADRPSSAVRVFSLAPYNVNVEQRQPRAQGASLHEAQAELFYVIDGVGDAAHRRHADRRRPAPGPTSPAPASRAAPASPSARATSCWCPPGCRTSSSTSRPRSS